MTSELGNNVSVGTQDSGSETLNEGAQEQSTETPSMTLSEMIESNPNVSVADIMGFENASTEEKTAAIIAHEKSETDRRVNQARKKFERERQEAELKATQRAEQKAREDLLLAENKQGELLEERTRQLAEKQAELDAIRKRENVDKLLTRKEIPVEFHDFYHLVKVEDDSLEELADFIDGFTKVMDERVKAEVERFKAELMDTGPAPGQKGGKTKQPTESLSLDAQIAKAVAEGDFGESLRLKTLRENEAKGVKQQFI